MGNVVVCCGEGETSETPNAGAGGRSVKIPNLRRSKDENIDGNDIIIIRQLSQPDQEKKIKAKDTEMKL